jgi:CHAT domain-containing protein
MEGRRIWEERFEPLAHELKHVDDLIVIPSGSMLGIPVEALIDDDGTYLCERFSVSYAPSATIYSWLCDRKGKRAPGDSGKALLIGDPPFSSVQHEYMRGMEHAYAARQVESEKEPGGPGRSTASARFDQPVASLPRLPATRDEVRAIAGIVPSPTVLLGPEASEQNMLELIEQGRLSEYSMIHIATHGLIDDDYPERSALVLSQVNTTDQFAAAIDGRRVFDGLVTAGEIVREWNLDADLVTLSACETGLGTRIEGEGYIGLSHAFMRAGARSLIVSLWKVEDRATRLLMQRFYENCYGKYSDKRLGKRGEPMTKAAALREAKLWLREYVDEDTGCSYASPYYWSAFILIGDRERVAH